MGPVSLRFRVIVSFSLATVLLLIFFSRDFAEPRYHAVGGLIYDGILLGLASACVLDVMVSGYKLWRMGNAHSRRISEGTPD